MQLIKVLNGKQVHTWGRWELTPLKNSSRARKKKELKKQNFVDYEVKADVNLMRFFNPGIIKREAKIL